MAQASIAVPPADVSAPPASLPRSILLALLSAVLLDFCFPVAGPLPHWRSLLAWVALAPLLWALLNDAAAEHPHYVRRAALTGWLCGVVWYALNCYWIYQTMLYYGHVPPFGSAGIVFLYSAILGLYFALFGLLLALFRRRLGVAWSLFLAPFLWTALDLAAARITSVPWDQLGYSQIDNLSLASLAPFTGVYGITFALVLFNVVFASLFVPIAEKRRWRHHVAAWIIIILMARVLLIRPSPATMGTTDWAVLLQPNIDVATNDNWQGAQWTGDINWILTQEHATCTPAYIGMPGPRAPVVRQPDTCPQNTPPPGLVVWPEVGSGYISNQPAAIALLHAMATTANAPVIFGILGQDSTGTYNSAVFVNPDGSLAGRYDKIHLVPFGEYIPYRKFFFFAHQLTHQLEDLQRGATRTVFTVTPAAAPGATPSPHTIGVFICYESIFADEIRQFTLNGAQVLVNVSDDGWYGDTSAPWQHLDMTRMRAIENHRWLLLDTNNGVTTVVDPWGRVTLSAPRHTLTSLVARYAYRSDLTFYTRYGDLFAYFCCLIAAVAVLVSLFSTNKRVVVRVRLHPHRIITDASPDDPLPPRTKPRADPPPPADDDKDPPRRRDSGFLG